MMRLIKKLGRYRYERHISIGGRKLMECYHANCKRKAKHIRVNTDGKVGFCEPCMKYVLNLSGTVICEKCSEYANVGVIE